ncbi:IF-2B-domain-containing protein [Metschnikowia bicuspidata var. bicuspidata NRRL YB-4993]|uniref:Translation initiation factor eIF2B subunit delta n=1 Tax=Metschnikowia bicuspidata var. bicuspidata NRRL YB-4993 TaxID=869754 RepID=A0A1A0H8U4_9ASCO|nr:IF-2B-domain-containing protein [Metschnikowia bicuspidata var. bicuspidata NRRL YB-4993]OBA20431.1 IF-2B-domain-containing protein [Metschnikowia bicuspidata var. bicuspidata NRRL YB-4993]
MSEEKTDKPEKQVKIEEPASEPGKISNKELKELKKKEKAAKRAAQKEAAGITPEQQEQMAQQKIEKKALQVTNTNLKKQLSQAVYKDDAKKIPVLFSHLETREQRNASSPTVSHIVHPAILTLSLNVASHKIVGSTARLREMLKVFKAVILDYKTPENTTLTRHLTGHLSHQIEYLKSARPLSLSMGNGIRWLKQEISLISIDTSEHDAKEILLQRIDDFIRERIELSDQLIIENSSHHITDGCTVLTFGHSEVLLQLFQHCVVEEGKSFNLVIVDLHPLFEGKKLLEGLVDTKIKAQEDEDPPTPHSRRTLPTPSITQEKLKITYVLINLLSSTVLEDVDLAFLGAHAMLSNGYLYSRVGTAMIAMMCNRRNISVLTCCESIKFSDRVQLDSVTTNELADPDDLLTNIDSKHPPQRKSMALEQFIKLKEELKKDDAPVRKQGNSDKKDAAADDSKLEPLKNWKSIAQLNILNIMYDLTPPHYINKVVTEFGALPPSSVPVILREYKNA